MSNLAVAQQSDLTFSFGESTFLGDLGGKPGLATNDFQDINLSSTRYAAGFTYRHKFNENWGFRTQFNYLRVSGNDKFTKNRERHMRNLSFFSNIQEFSVAGEFYLGKTGMNTIFVGAGVFHFNPKTRYNNQVYTLRNYGTEGQYFLPGKKPYSLYSLCIPFGVQFLVKAYRDNSFLSCEIGFRKSFTDYIDDVSTNFVDKTALAASNGQMAVNLSDRSVSDIPGFSAAGAIRGDSKDKDNYSYIVVTYSIPLGFRGRKFWGNIKDHLKRSPGGFFPGKF